MAALRDLVQMSLEELWQAHLGNRISDQIRNHTNQNAIRPLSHIGFYRDCGNYAGSLVMLMLLFPQDFLHQGEATISALPLVNGAGDRADALRVEGARSQRSGRIGNFPCEGGATATACVAASGEYLQKRLFTESLPLSFKPPWSSNR